VILWCDAIREEYEELLSYCYEMQECLDNSIFEEDDMPSLRVFLKTSRISPPLDTFTSTDPRFSAL
jgi:hypothetical protein